MSRFNGVAQTGSLLRRHWLCVILFLLLLAFYVAFVWLKHGGDTWWYADIVNGSVISWGDDAYRFYLAKTAWTNPQIYWFNFVLPVYLFFEGILTSLAGGHLLDAKLLKAVVATASIFFVYRACIAWQIKKELAALASGFLALLPLFFFVQLSFYGESWFGFLIALSLFLYASGRKSASYFIISLMPLVRPEGIAFVGFMSLYGLARRDWRCFFIPGSSGFIYFMLILLVGPGLGTFLRWRHLMHFVYAGASNWYGGNPAHILGGFSIVWMICAVIGCFLRRAEGLLPFVLASVLILAYGAIAMALNKEAFEARYYSSVMPVFAVCFAFFLQYAFDFLTKRYSRAAIGSILAVLLIWIMGGQILTMDAPAVVWSYVKRYHQLPEVIRQRPTWPGAYFQGTTATAINSYRKLADVVTRMLHVNTDIKTLIVGNVRLFYFLDPDKIPDRVRVVFPPFRWVQLGSILDKKATAGYFAKEPYAGIFNLTVPTQGSDQILYVDRMKLEGYPYHWKVGLYSVYLFGGKLQRTPGSG